MEFIKYYAHVLKPYIVTLLVPLVNRIIAEHNYIRQNGDLTNCQSVINKSLNIVRMSADNPCFMPEMYDQFEELLKPLFVFIENPSVISFDEDLVILIKTLIKKKGSISPIVWEMLPHLPKVLAKNKQSFGNLMDCLNHYLAIGKP